MAELGTAWRSPQPPRHIFIVISNPNVQGGVVVVNFSTLRETSTDDACILKVGDYPPIRHETTVVYSRAKLYNLSKMDAALRAGVLQEVDNIEGALLQRMMEGAVSSIETPRNCKELVQGSL